MKAILLFRISAVLIVLFAAGHTVGFWQLDPSWGITDAVTTLKTSRFETQGFTRTFWDFYVGFGLLGTLFLLLSAFLAWYLGGAAAGAWAALKPGAWALTASFACTVLLTARYFFTAPVVFSSLIFLCLLAGCLSAHRAWNSGSR